MKFKQNGIAALTLACLAALAILSPRMGQAQDSRVTSAMQLLESMATQLGPPKTDGTDAVAGKEVPAIYFGSTKMNNNFELVDEVAKKTRATATIFVKQGDEYVRVATNVKKDDGSRAIGTVLDPAGKAIESIRKDEPFYGEVDILGKPYITGYKPIHDASKTVIGIYYVGYLK
jgi:Cache 3/Cache 2 fusion domain